MGRWTEGRGGLGGGQTDGAAQRPPGAGCEPGQGALPGKEGDLEAWVSTEISGLRGRPGQQRLSAGGRRSQND